ncbi:MAG: hypothetical protein KIS67_02395 [Verrucomicrobiae bacterium]|nr:hypothetical protein [Verrucomicrobiae bacterium]
MADGVHLRRAGPTAAAPGTDGQYGGWYLGTTTSYLYDGMRVIYTMRYSKQCSFVGPAASGSAATVLGWKRRLSHGVKERAGNPTVSYTRGRNLSGSLEGAGGIGGLLARSHGYSSGNWSTHNFYHTDAGGI